LTNPRILFKMSVVTVLLSVKYELVICFVFHFLTSYFLFQMSYLFK
jgi:hypothetical protein